MIFKIIYKLKLQNQCDRLITNINGLWALNTKVPWQHVRKITIQPLMRIIHKSEGNSFARLKIKNFNPNESREFTAELIVETNRNFISDESLKIAWKNEYLKERKFWEFIPDLQEFITSIRSHPDDEKIILTNKFVNSKIKLRTNLTERLGAKKVMQTLEGDCDEFSDLTISILRQLLIPARRIVGYYYKQDGETIGHAWLEAYVNGKWIQIDPALNRLVNLNEKYIARLRQGFKSDISVISVNFTGFTPNIIKIDETTEIYKIR